MEECEDERDVEEVERSTSKFAAADVIGDEGIRMAIKALEEKGLVEFNKETGVAMVDDNVLKAALARLEGDEGSGIIEVDDAAMGLAMQPSSFKWRRVDRQILESMEELLVTLHSPALQIMTPTALNPIVPALKPIAHAQRAYAQWKKAEAKREADEQEQRIR